MVGHLVDQLLIQNDPDKSLYNTFYMQTSEKHVHLIYCFEKMVCQKMMLNNPKTKIVALLD